MKTNYNKTIYACFTGYIVQAIVNNFAPLLFLTFQKSYQIPLSKITMLVAVNFMLQLIVDLIAIKFIDKIGYRISAVGGHIICALGLILMTILPNVLTNSFTGLLISVVVYAIGGGLLEVLISPIVEACPTEHKEKTMSLLHSFYCWGHVGVVLLSTLFFSVFGILNWKALTLIWAIVPIVNAMVFTKVPIVPLIAEGGSEISLKELANKKIFWILMLTMVCAGASEQAVSQWASTFVEKMLGMNKSIGDLVGPMMFATFMGISRTIYGKYGDKIDLNKFMLYSCALCVTSYIMIWLSPFPFVGILGCALCGFSVGILWPGTFSVAAISIKNSGTAMYALLALAGDLGCAGGPALVGLVSGMFHDNLQIGILTAIIFPILLIGCIIYKNKFLYNDKKIKE